MLPKCWQGWFVWNVRRSVRWFPEFGLVATELDKWECSRAVLKDIYYPGGIGIPISLWLLFETS
jgi:hypothetical protein